MLSAEELQRTHELLAHLPSTSLTTKQQQNVRQRLRHKLKEHAHATKYRPFQPLPHNSYFVNHTTSDSTLIELIQAATTSSEFTLDTESDRIYKKPNKPTLIQLQILLPNDFSFAVVIEMCYLPRDNHPKFQLIQELFRHTFSSDKIIYIWGTKDELFPFVQYKLFTIEHINCLRIINLQFEFKLFWTQHHPHCSSNFSTSSLCLCETCIGKLPLESWSLQDSAAYALNEYLSKIFRNHNFGIGLDPQLFHRNALEINHRLQLTNYALNDCLSMQRLIIHMKTQQYKFPFSVPPPVSHDILELSPVSPIDSIRLSPYPTPQHTEPIPIDTPPVPTSTSNHFDSPPPHSSSIRRTSTLSADERHHIHNRRCTVKRRIRLNAFTIIKRNIDLRFRVHEIKAILSSLDIDYKAVNAPISHLTGKRSLYIGFTDNAHLHEYEYRIRYLFTSQHYHQLHRHHSQHFRRRYFHIH